MSSRVFEFHYILIKGGGMTLHKLHLSQSYNKKIEI